MKNLAPRFTVGLATLVALAAFACSGAPETSSIPGSEKDEAPTTAKKADDKNAQTDTNTTTPAPSTPLSETSECGKKTTAKDCGACCIAKNPAAFEAASEVGYACVCAATACQTACADSTCAAADNQNEPNAACKACLDDKGPACDDKATAACDTNADCKAIDACLVTSCDPILKREGAGGSPTPKVLNVRTATRSFRRQ